MINSWILSIAIVLVIMILIGTLALGEGNIQDIAMGIVVLIALITLTCGVHHVIELVRLTRGV